MYLLYRWCGFLSVLWNDDFRRIITRAAVPILALALKKIMTPRLIVLQLLYEGSQRIQYLTYNVR